MSSVTILRSDREDDLANGNTGSHFHWLTVGTTHTGGETICTGAGKHLVLTDDVERVGTATNVVTFLTSGLDKVLVACDTSGFKSASGQLFLFVGDQVGDEWELVDWGLLGTAIINSDLGIWDTTAETRLDVRLVLLETNATSWSYRQRDGKLSTLIQASPLGRRGDSMIRFQQLREDPCKADPCKADNRREHLLLPILYRR